MRIIFFLLLLKKKKAKHDLKLTEHEEIPNNFFDHSTIEPILLPITIWIRKKLNEKKKEKNLYPSCTNWPTDENLSHDTIILLYSDSLINLYLRVNILA